MMQYQQFRNAVTPYMKKDEYSCRAAGERYLVRSLYYDSDDFYAYRQKVNGEFSRIKLRLRTYSKSPADEQPVRAELKTRRGLMVKKYSTFVDYADYCDFMSFRHWPELNGSSTLVEFQRLLYLRDLKPKILLDYHRECYIPRFSKDDIRITFDHSIQSARATSLFQDKPFFRPHRQTPVVAEIKCTDKNPQWLTNIIKTHSLKSLPNSKYAQAVEISYPSFIISPTFFLQR